MQVKLFAPDLALYNLSTMQNDRSVSQRMWPGNRNGRINKKYEYSLLYLKLGIKSTFKQKKLALQLGIKREILRWLIMACLELRHFASYYEIVMAKSKNMQIFLAWKINNQSHSLFNKREIKSWSMQVDSQKLTSDPIGELSWIVNPRLAFGGLLYCQLNYTNKELFSCI